MGEIEELMPLEIKQFNANADSRPSKEQRLGALKEIFRQLAHMQRAQDPTNASIFDLNGEEHDASLSQFIDTIDELEKTCDLDALQNDLLAELIKSGQLVPAEGVSELAMGGNVLRCNKATEEEEEEN